MYLFKSDMFVHNYVSALNILPNISLPFSKIVLVVITGSKMLKLMTVSM